MFMNNYKLNDKFNFMLRESKYSFCQALTVKDKTNL